MSASFVVSTLSICCRLSSSVVHSPHLLCTLLICCVLSSSVVYSPQLLCTLLSCYVLSSAVVYSPHLLCTLISCCVLSSAVVYSPQLLTSVLSWLTYSCCSYCYYILVNQRCVLPSAVTKLEPLNIQSTRNSCLTLCHINE